MEMEEGPGRGADGSCLGATVVIGGAGVDTLLGTRAMIGAGVGVLLGTRLGARDGALVTGKDLSGGLHSLGMDSRIRATCSGSVCM